ncbi:peptidylprolyl isomerase SurA [Photobacterium aquimaris]|uniref:peptidylprolyl isomerase SurA n=1 Tax=Photobacterium aquimaris TaxID=512643 RepID=UPI0007EF4B6B|nr:peptidylprolyl isomerase SurA [Photobacterium aquimaris]OBU17711.1 peptidylprolyl isomerase SurA [Photobacterium aquimaris]PSV99524.1 peptidylprolyl isomerase SurA [Photobacterium aquimaris]
MKKWKYSAISVMLMGMTATAMAAPQPQELNQIVTTVNDGVILQSDVNSMLKTVHLNAAAEGQQLPPNNILRQQVMDKLIMETLQIQQAKQLGLRIDDSQLDQAIADVAKQRNVTVSQLRQQLASAGISFSMFREQLRNDMLASEARTIIVRKRVNILPQEVDSLAAQLAKQTQQNVQYNISQIQIAVDDDADKATREKAKQEANKIYGELKQGANFAELAYRYSKGPKALKGGEWGWMSKDEMPTIFADQIKTSSKDSIIGPFRSGVGYHILKINDVKGMPTVSAVEVKARHILIKTSIILSDAAAKKELQQIRQKIISGKESFAAAAKQYSEDPGSASNGGQLGWQLPSMYAPAFEKEVETLPVDQISQPFKSQFGWHIVEVEGRRNVDRTEAALKNRAAQILFNRKFNEEAQTWLQELRAGAYIEQMNKVNNG